MDRFLPERMPFTNKRLPVRVILSYIFDYGIIVVLGVAYAAIDKIVTPFHQPFSLRNYTIQYPYAEKERIPIPIALILAVVIPMVIIAIYTLVLDGIFSHRRKNIGAGWSSVYQFQDRLWELNCGILGLFLAEGAAFVITGSLKNLCGKPRPDLIARCLPREGSVDPPVFGLSNFTICTQTDAAIMADGFRSFPSGHSSSAFAGLFYLSLYLAAKLHVLDNRGEVWRTFIVLIPTLAASCIAMSRIMDARHHPFDVLFGSALGILVAWAAYRQYFPPVGETWKKGRAYPIRTWGTEMKGPPGTVGNDIMHKDPGMEPYRTRGPAATSSAHMPSVSARSSDEQSGNVFRAQISRSQRQRTLGGGDEAEAAAAAGGGHQNPYVTTADGARYMSPHARDEWSASASSSEDELPPRRNPAGGGSKMEAYEMQRPTRGPGTGDPEGGAAAAASPGQGVRHVLPSQRVGGEQEDTAYRSQTAAAVASSTHPGQRVLM